MADFWLRCVDGGERYTVDDLTKGDFYTCLRHEPDERYSNLVFEYDLEKVIASGGFNPRSLRARTEPRSILRYAPLLPISDGDIPSLGEGWTTLYGATPDTAHVLDDLKRELDIEDVNLFAKYEGTNQTGSFKDRGMVIAVKRAQEIQARATAAASTGNTSASAADYSIRARIPFYAFLPKNVASGKIAQAIVYGAHVVPIDGTFDDAIRLLREVRKPMGFYLLNSVNPLRVEGQSTVAYEIWEWNGYESPDVVVIPVGNGANIGAQWRGFDRLYRLGVASKRPRMIGVQAEGAAPIVKAIETDSPMITPVDRHYTIASAIDIGDPVNAKLALMAIRESGGSALAVSDEQTLKAQDLLRKTTGIWAEPASCVTVAALPEAKRRGLIRKGDEVAIILTGAGWKAPEIYEDRIKEAMENPIQPTREAFEGRFAIV